MGKVSESLKNSDAAIVRLDNSSAISDLSSLDIPSDIVSSTMEEYSVPEALKEAVVSLQTFPSLNVHMFRGCSGNFNDCH